MDEPVEERYEVVGKRGVIVRAAAAMDSDVVGELPRGTKLWVRGGQALETGARAPRAVPFGAVSSCRTRSRFLVGTARASRDRSRAT